jgi:hypothetical protein
LTLWWTNKNWKGDAFEHPKFPPNFDDFILGSTPNSGNTLKFFPLISPLCKIQEIPEAHSTNLAFNAWCFSGTVWVKSIKIVKLRPVICYYYEQNYLARFAERKSEDDEKIGRENWKS